MSNRSLLMTAATAVLGGLCFAAPADADVLCLSESGALAVRAACPASERQVSSAEFARLVPSLRGPRGFRGPRGLRGPEGPPAPPPPAASSGLITLRPLDYQHTLCLTDGDYGLIVENHSVYNRCSHLDFGYYERNGFRLGVQGNDVGAIVDLGAADQVSSTYNTDAYYSIRKDPAADRLLIGRDGEQSLVPLVEAASLATVDHDVPAAATPGHVYVGRVVSANDPDLWVKFLVVELPPDMSATIRWERLE